MVASTELTQAWVFGHRLLPREAYTLQRRFLLSLRKVTSDTVLSRLWAEAAKGVENGTWHLPKTLSVVRVERIGALEFVVIQLPPPVGPGPRFIGIVFSEVEGRYVDEVESGTRVYSWFSDGSGASLRFIGAAGFVPARPGTSIATGGSLGFFDDASLDSFVRVVEQRHAVASGLSGAGPAPEAHRRPADSMQESRWRKTLFRSSLLLMAIGAFFGIPAVLDGIDGRFPSAVTCAQLEDRRFRAEYEGRYVVLSGCEFSFDELRGSVHLNNGVSQLSLSLFTPPRTTRAQRVVDAVIVRSDLVSPFSLLNASQAAAMRRGTFLESAPDPDEVKAVAEARAKISQELASGMGGVLAAGDFGLGTKLLHGAPPGSGLGYVLLFVIGGVFALLALLAPRHRLTWLFAAFAAFDRSSGRQSA